MMQSKRAHAHRGRRSATYLARSVCGALIALALAAPPERLAAQDGADRERVLAVIDRLFEGMRTNEGDVVASVFVDGAVLISTEDREGNPAPRVMPVTGFVDAVRNATIPWDEPYWDPVVHIEDHLATAWVRYAFYAGDEFSHCGVDTFILARSGESWKIAALADTRQREDCEMPPGRGGSP